MSQMVANVASITKHWTIEGYLEAGAKTPVYYRISGMAKVTTETKGVKTEDFSMVLLLQLTKLPHTPYLKVSTPKAPCNDTTHLKGI